MDQKKEDQPVWMKDAGHAAKVGAVVAAVITVLGGIPAFMIMSGSNPTILKTLGILVNLGFAFLGYWIVCSILAFIVRLAAKGISKFLGRQPSKK